MTLDTNGDLYLCRYYFWRKSKTPKWVPARVRKLIPSIYLHYFYRGDLDEELHNHPWVNSMSLILTNGYYEDRLTPDGVVRRKIRPGSLNFIRCTDFHRVDLIDPTKGAWTLFITGQRVQEWGFKDIDTGKYTYWETFVEEREQNARLTLPN